MNVPAAALKKMLDCGLSLADALEIAELMRAPSKGAERQRRFRERRAAGVTRDVTCNADSNVTGLLEEKVSPTPPSKTQTSNLSEPKGSSRITTRAREAADFEAFWRAYPRREGKGAAAKAFPKALAKIAAPDPLGVMLAGLERAKAMWRDPQFIPHPATWLNQERWTDEPTITPPSPANDRPSPRPDDRFDRRQANLARAFAGAEVAAGFGDGWGE